MLNYLKKFAVDIFPSVAATVIGAYIVNHYIVSRPSADAPAAAASTANPKAEGKAEAKSDVQVDTPEVRVTEWRLAPGSATGHHTHGMDYVIVPVTAGEMTIVAPNGERTKAQLGAGKSYFRKAGVEHDVLNETASEIVFLEVELKP